MFEDVSIVLIVKEDKEFVDEMLKYHPELLDSEDVIVIDSGGGKNLQDYATYYDNVYLGLGEARKYSISIASKEYTLIVDVDAELPENFIENSLNILKNKKGCVVVALDYYPLTGHLGFGTSIWKTRILKELYNWKQDNNSGVCECMKMWNKVRKRGYRIETLSVHAIHHKKNIGRGEH